MPRRSADGDGAFQRPPGSGVYWARWKDHEGHVRAKRMGHGEKCRKLAMSYAAEQNQRAIERGLWPERFEEVPVVESWTVAEAIEYYQENSRASKRGMGHSFARDEGHAKYFTELWGNRVLQDIEAPRYP